METTASIITILELSSKIILYTRTAYQGKDDRERLRDQLEGYCHILQLLKEDSDDPDAQITCQKDIRDGAAVGNHLQRLSKALKPIKEELSQIGDEKGRLRWPFEKIRVVELMSAIDKEMGLLFLALQNDSERILCGLETRTRKIGAQSKQLAQSIQDAAQTHVTRLHELDDNNSEIGSVENTVQEREKTQRKYAQNKLKWLISDAKFAQLNACISKEQHETGKWILESEAYQNWYNSSGQTLYCPGRPGSGKTFITQVVARHIRSSYIKDDSIKIAAIYCNRIFEENQTIELLLSDIVRQLVEDEIPLPKDVKELWDKHNCGQERPSSESILHTLHQIVDRLPRVFILIDGLDECQTAQSLVKLVLDLHKRGHANILITSRFTPQFDRWLRGISRCVIKASKEDIHSYVDDQIHHLPVCVQNNPDLQNEIKTTLCGSVDGMFLLAKLRVEFLKLPRSAKAVRNTLCKLATKNSGESSDPESEAYDSAYTLVMDSIQGQGKGASDLAMETLAWLIFAKKPLSSMALQEALAVELDEPDLDPSNLPDIEEVVLACKGLVVVDEASTVRFVHHTAQEFFQRHQDQYFPRGEQRIARVCAAYLSFDIYNREFEPYNRLDTFDRNDLSEFDDCYGKEMHRNTHHFYGYAACFWGEHARHLSTIYPQISRLLERPSNVCMAGYVLQRSWVRTSKYVDEFKAAHLLIHFDLQEISVLLERELNIGPSARIDYDDQDLFSFAIRAEREYFTEQFICRGAGVECTNSYTGDTPLHIAADAYAPGITRLLLKYGANINAINKCMQTPLHIAAGRPMIVQILIDHKADLDVVDEKGRTPLFLTIDRFERHRKIGITLISAGADVNKTESLLVKAIGFRDKDLANALILAGADVNATGSFGRTPLSQAIERPFTQIMDALIAAGADVNARHGSGLPLLNFALWRYNLNAFKLLLANGANPEARYKGQSVLTYAANLKEFRGNLYWTAWRSHDTAIQLLIDAGARVNCQDDDGRSPLHYAAKNCNIFSVHKLLELGANPNATDAKANTPLMLLEYEMDHLLDNLCPSGYRIAQRIVRMLEMAAEEGSVGE